MARARVGDLLSVLAMTARGAAWLASRDGIVHMAPERGAGTPPSWKASPGRRTRGSG